ncbi:MAG: hypothetical protein CMH56_06040 [Myxococcales bacterium]|nr:hypothetical protein [Myxococcales bacterium]|tara:strand:+ start:1453 stop:2199 length:747 start_codon:yes stop_codon:yes gene_type:complete
MTTLIFIHSSGLGPSQWKRYQEDFDQWHPIVPALLDYEQEGHTADFSQFTIDDDVALIEGVLPEDEDVVLVGHSYGGMVALQLALKDPERIQGMVLFEPVAYGIVREGIEDKEEMEKTITTFLKKGHISPKMWIEVFLDYWNGDGAFAAMNAEQKVPFLRHANKIFAEVRNLMADETGAAAYEALQMPVMVMAGEKTITEMNYLCSKLVQHLPQGELHHIEDAGHMAPVTEYGKVAHHLLRFLEQLQS